MQLIKQGTYGNLTYKIYKVGDLYYTQLIDNNGNSYWGQDNDLKTSVKNAALKYKSTNNTNTETNNTNTETNNNNNSGLELLKKYLDDLKNGIFHFGSEVSDKLPQTYVYKYIDARNKIMAQKYANLAKQLAEAGYDKDSLVKALESTMIKDMGFNPYELGGNYLKLLDNLYALTKAQLGITNFNQLIDSVRNNKGQYDENRIKAEQPTLEGASYNKTPEQYATQTINDNEIANQKAEVESQLDNLANELDKKGMGQYANIIRAYKGNISASKNLSSDILGNYKQYIQNMQNTLKKLEGNYEAQREFIENFLNEKFGELDEKAKQLEQLTQDEYNKQQELIKKKIDAQRNIAEGLATKGQGSRAQEFATNANIDNAYLSQEEQARKDYINNMNKNYSTIANLYSNWLNNQQQIQGTWAKPLYDTIFNTQSKLLGGQQSNYEQYRNKVYNTSASALQNATNTYQQAINLLNK